MPFDKGVGFCVPKKRQMRRISINYCNPKKLLSDRLVIRIERDVSEEFPVKKKKDENMEVLYVA